VTAKGADDRRWNRDYGVLYGILEQKWQSLGTESDTSVQRETRIKRCEQWASQQFMAQSVEWPGEIGNIWVDEDKTGAKRVHVNFAVGHVDGPRATYRRLLTNLQPRDAPNIPKGSGAVLCARIADIVFRGGIQVSIGNSVTIRLRR